MYARKNLGAWLSFASRENRTGEGDIGRARPLNMLEMPMT